MNQNKVTTKQHRVPLAFQIYLRGCKRLATCARSK